MNPNIWQDKKKCVKLCPSHHSRFLETRRTGDWDEAQDCHYKDMDNHVEFCKDWLVLPGQMGAYPKAHRGIRQVGDIDIFKKGLKFVQVWFLAQGTAFIFPNTVVVKLAIFSVPQDFCTKTTQS